MLYDWAFAQRGYGVLVIDERGGVAALEFNELLRRIAKGSVQPDDEVVSSVFTDGVRRRVGDLRVYELVRNGAVETDDLPLRSRTGVLATGREAQQMLAAVEQNYRLGPEPAEAEGRR